MCRFDASLQRFFKENEIDKDSFDDVLIAGGVANCNYVYDYIQRTFRNAVGFFSPFHS